MDLYVSALRSYHVDHMFDTAVFSSDTLRRIIKGALNLYGKTGELRLPITRHILAKICTKRPISKSEANLRACWLLAFTGFMRIGELTYEAKDVALDFSRRHVTRGSIRISPNYDHMILLLPRSKTDIKNEGVQILIAATSDELCPIQAILDLHHIDPQPESAPLFNFNGTAWSKARARLALHNSLVAEGVNPMHFRLHSFRKGAAQHAHSCGLRDDQIQMLGRWSSEALRRYFTQSPVVLYATSIHFQTGRPLPFRL
jgi:integrase